MSDLFFEAISDDIIREKLKLFDDETISYRFVDKVGQTPITIIFTDKDRSAWIGKYKREYYGSILSNIERQDEFTYIDIYKTLRENASKTIKSL
jgi:hypothetical protein